MNSNQPICPSYDDLNLFAIGELPVAVIDDISSHVVACHKCESLLNSIEMKTNDELIGEIQSLNLQPTESNGSEDRLLLTVPRNLVQVAKNVIYEEEANQISLDPGRRLAKRLADGVCRIGRFELQSELGTGSSGHVFKAHDTELDRTVALKVQRAGELASNEDVERFLREARSLAQLKHPGIVSVYDTVRSDDDVCYLVTEYIAGESLESRLQNHSFTPRESANLIAKIGNALQYAHSHGVVHRDIKPSNVLLDNNDHSHVTDFGLAKRDIEAGNTVTSEGRVMGTPAYMSPEQARGDSHHVDARSDIYSLGVMLYELLTGERPFQGKRRMLLLQVIEDEPRSPRQLESNIPRDLETICLKAISKTPGRRYQTAADMVADLRCFLRGEAIKARPIGYAERFWQWCRTYPLAASLLVAVPLVSLGGFAYLSWLSTYFVHSTALESTRMEADMLETINEFYSENVIAPLDPDEVKVTHEYATTPNSIPLPFTFMIDAGERITKDKTGMQVKMYSEYPWRCNTGPKDEFEVRAIRTLTDRVISSPKLSDLNDEMRTDARSYHEFIDQNGEPVLRYARAQIMQQSCIQCHNSFESSPKRDWAEGDVAGVLAITRPLHRDIQTTRSGLRSAFNMIAAVAVGLMGLSLFLLWLARNQSSVGEFAGVQP